MFKNVASQKIQLFAFDTTTGAPKTGDAANITAYVSKDHGTVTVLGDSSATEMDSTNAKGVYVFDLTQGETNADELTFTAKSSTANISITPRFISTVPPSWAMTLTSGERNTFADVVLTRDWTSTVAAIGTIPARCMLNALRFLRNKWTLSSGTLSVKEEDDSTEAWSAAVTGTAGADPVTGVDPT